MPSSFVCVIECEIQDWAKHGIEKIEKAISDISNADIDKLFPTCTVDDMNYLLFTSAPEESEINGVSNFYLPEFLLLIIQLWRIGLCRICWNLQYNLLQQERKYRPSFSLQQSEKRKLATSLLPRKNKD